MNNKIHIVENEDGKFVWRVLSPDQSHTLLLTGCIELYAVYQDDTESLIPDSRALQAAIKDETILVCLEVGRLNVPDKNHKPLPSVPFSLTVMLYGMDEEGEPSARDNNTVKYNVWVRKDYNNSNQPFEALVGYDLDFDVEDKTDESREDAYEEAYSKARDWALELQCEIEEY